MEAFFAGEVVAYVEQKTKGNNIFDAHTVFGQNFRMERPEAIRKFIFDSIIWLGALSCILVWLGVKPKDLLGWHVTPPQSIWLISALVLVALGIYRSFKPRIMIKEVVKTIEIARAEPKPETKLTIHRAIFGAGPQAQKDITLRLNERERDDLVLNVDQNLAPQDPAVNVIKTLQIEYSYDGNRYLPVVRRESPPGQIPPRLVLPEDSEIRILREEHDNYKAAAISADQVVGRLRSEIAELSKSKNEDDLCASLKKIVAADASHIGDRVREANHRLEFSYDSRSDPYIDVITELWNGSILTWLALATFQDLSWQPTAR